MEARVTFVHSVIGALVSLLESLAASSTCEGELVTGPVKIEVSVVFVLSFNKLLIVAWKFELIAVVLFFPAVRASTAGVAGFCEAKKSPKSNPACETVGLAMRGVLGALELGEE